MLSHLEQRTKLENLLSRIRKNRDLERMPARDLVASFDALSTIKAQIRAEDTLLGEPSIMEEILPPVRVEELESQPVEYAISATQPVLAEPFDQLPDILDDDLREKSIPISVERAFPSEISGDVILPAESDEIEEQGALVEATHEIEEQIYIEPPREIEERAFFEAAPAIEDKAKDSAYIEEPVKYEAAVAASQEIAVINGALIQKKWTIKAVLERAWKLGADD